MLKVGISKQEINCYEPNVGLLGYGKYGNIVEGQETPLYTRAFVFQQLDKTKRFAFVNMEICFPTIILKQVILEKLDKVLPGFYNDDNLMLSAQHTHSAPGGITQYILYNIPTPGFQKSIFESYVKSVVDAIVDAQSNLQSANICLKKGTFPDHQEVAFNRSVKPYNSNPEVEKPYAKDEAHLAVDREMRLLHFDDGNGKTLGSINWFGVHTTSLSNDVNKICYDNKGYAAEYLESTLHAKNRDAVCIFAQDAAGDISPNFVWDKKKKWTRGKFECDIESAKYNGKLQADLAQKILDGDDAVERIEGEIDYLTLFFDMSNITLPPSYTQGKPGMGTSPACFGFSFLTGTKEGPGVDPVVGKIIAGIMRPCKLIERRVLRSFLSTEERKALDRKYAAQEPKTIAMEAGLGQIFFIKRIKNAFFIPGAVDPVIKSFKTLDKNGWLQKAPWIPQVLPLQIVILGQLALIGIPAEITIIAGKRLRNAIKKTLSKRGVTNIILCPYSNAYSGYITTPQEYQHQAYEGGHTLFGKWTLPAYQMKFDIVAKELLKKEQDRNINPKGPVMFSDEEIWYGA